ncbi:MAG: hypothetical protein ACU0DK_09265 [Pseudooceanicola sp.]
MNKSFTEFNNRLRSIDRKARAREDGYRPRIRKDGLIELEPQRRPLRKRIPLKYVVGFLGGAIAYKVFLLLKLGEADYAFRLANLIDGTMVNQVGATILQIDPVTRMLTDFVRPLVG